MIDFLLVLESKIHVIELFTFYTKKRKLHQPLEFHCIILFSSFLFTHFHFQAAFHVHFKRRPMELSKHKVRSKGWGRYCKYCMQKPLELRHSLTVMGSCKLQGLVQLSGRYRLLSPNLVSVWVQGLRRRKPRWRRRQTERKSCRKFINTDTAYR